MSSTRGPPFAAPATPASLRTWAAELNAALPSALPDWDIPGLVHRASPGSGRGTFLADGYTLPHGARVAAYWGSLTLLPPPSSHFLLELPDTRMGSSTVVPYVDAARVCLRGSPPTSQAAMLNHKCEDPSCAASWYWPPGCHLPILVCTTRRSLSRGAELTYNYDAHLRSGAYTVGPAEAHALTLLGHTFSSCFCEGHRPCPGRRFFPCDPITETRRH